ncbi:MAG: YybH family protein [Chthoniobacterales bacterium]
MFRTLTLIVLPTLLAIAAIIPASSASPPPSPSPASAATASPTPTQAENQAGIRKVLEAQQIAWNHGDIDTFMDGYWRSRDTRFVSGDTVTRGWQTVHDRYKAKYSDHEKMGQLTFSDIEVSMFGYDGALVFGRWQLQRATDHPHGRFTLVFRKTPDGWKIVHDHTSVADDS